MRILYVRYATRGSVWRVNGYVSDVIANWWGLVGMDLRRRGLLRNRRLRRLRRHGRLVVVGKSVAGILLLELYRGVVPNA